MYILLIHSSAKITEGKCTVVQQAIFLKDFPSLLLQLGVLVHSSLPIKLELCADNTSTMNKAVKRT